MVEELLENSIFNSFLNLIPYLPSFFDDDVLFSISDREKYLKVIGADALNLNVKDGDLVSHDGADFEAMKYGKTASKIIDKSVFGNAIKSIAVPIKNKSGQVIGCISVVKSLKRQDEILNISSSLSSSLEQISSVVSNITEGIQEVASSTEEIVAGVENTNNDAKNTDEIIRFVKNVADQTNLLGLNAAIEAARAGEMGRGFSVVAQEIRKLSHSSGESIKKIDDVLKNMQKSISGITDKINSANSIFQDQAASLEEISASIQELNSTAHVLAEISSKL